MSVSVPLGNKSGASMRSKDDHPFSLKTKLSRSEFASRGGERWPRAANSSATLQNTRNRRQSPPHSVQTQKRAKFTTFLEILDKKNNSRDFLFALTNGFVLEVSPTDIIELLRILLLYQINKNLKYRDSCFWVTYFSYQCKIAAKNQEAACSFELEKT